MKKNVLLFVSNMFYLKFFTFLFFNFLTKNYKSAVHPPYIRMLYRSDNKYYYINYYKIFFYHAGVANAMPDQKLQFPSLDQYVETEEDADKISLGIYKKNSDVEDLIVIKNYVYAIKYETYYCYFKVNEINGYSAQIFPFKCINSNCWHLIGIINSSSQLWLYLYKKTPRNCNTNNLLDSFNINNVGSQKFSCQFMQSPSNGEILTCFYQNKNTNEIIANNLNIDITNNNINSLFTKSQSNNNGAKYIRSVLSQDETKAYVCYINNNNNCECLKYDITNNNWSGKATYLNNCLSTPGYFYIDYFDYTDEYFLYCYQPSLYLITLKLNNKFEKTHIFEKNFDTSLTTCSQYFYSSLLYYPEAVYISVFCHDTLKFKKVGTLVQLPTTIPTTILTTIPTIIPTTILTTIPTTILTTIPTTILTTIPTTILTTIPTTILTTIPTTIPTKIPTSILTTIPTTIPTKIPTTIPTIIPTIIPTTLPERKDTSTITIIPKTFSYIVDNPLTSVPNIINDNLTTIFNNNEKENEIIIEKIYKTKEEIIGNLDEFIKKYDTSKINEIFGSDYKIKIAPINNNNHQKISTYIDFSNCENLLREANGYSSSNLLTVFQIEINNPSEQALINNVEYAVYNENKERLNLSKCKDEKITIHYQLNTSKIDMSKVRYYSEMGIDIFNINDDFFNDICYPYFVGDADVILEDRVTDIYQNYSVCEDNCESNLIDFIQNTVSCSCSTKTFSVSDLKMPTLASIFRDTLSYSSIGVIKCYRLVFRIKDKFLNIGFCIFTVLVSLHIPLFIHYCINTLSKIKAYIYRELVKYDYYFKIENSKKKGNIKITNKGKKSKAKNNLKNDILKKKRNQRIIKNEIKKVEENSTTLRLNKVRNETSDNNLRKNKVKNASKNIKSKFGRNVTDKDLLALNKKNKKSNKHNIFIIKNTNKNYLKSTNISSYSEQILYNEKNFEKNVDNNYKDSEQKYYLIQMDANNTSNKKPFSSKIILDNYDYPNAISYDKRTFCQIFYICILGKENIINILFFNTPLDIISLRICLFIFSYACDFAFNALFYFNENISKKYHYEGKSLFLFSLINNIFQTLFASISGLILVNLFEHLIDYRGSIEDIFKDEENKMRKNKNYKVTTEMKLKIIEKIHKISNTLERKISLFMIFEFLIMLFFYYFVTAFCEVYRQTQITWLYDCLIGFFISICVEIGFAFLLSLMYKISIKYKKKFIYNVTMFGYNI